MASKKKKPEVSKALKEQHLYCMEVLIEEIRVMREDSRMSLASNKSGRNGLKLNRRTYLSSQGSRRSTLEQRPEEMLPPLRVGIDLFKMKDMYVHQVDLEKLYPRSEEEVSEDSLTPPDTPPQTDKEEVRSRSSSRGSKTRESSLSPSKSDKSKRSRSKGSTSSKGTRSSGEKSRSTRSRPSVPESVKSEAGSGKKDSHISKRTSESKESKGNTESKESKGNTESKASSVGQSELFEGVDAKELEEALQTLQECPSEVVDDRKQREAIQRMLRRERRELERERRAEEEHLRAVALRKLQWAPEFRRGVSLLFTSTPEELIQNVMRGRLKLRVERWNGTSPPMKVGRSSLQLPSSYAELIHRAATGPKESLVHEETGVLKDDRGEAGSVRVYLCLTCLGRAATGASLISDCGLYSFIKLSEKLPPCFKHEPATAFQSEGLNLKKVRHKAFSKTCCKKA